ncbi:MAG: glycosyltransferase family 2 protein [Segetibacter sp.]|jgi:hypothetical protein|nr:glycosyltransferase family 2 protein [Segetibacter sp.]
MEILISGSIVLYNSEKGLMEIVRSFLNTSLPVKLYLIDNSPTNQLESLLADLLLDQRVIYIFNNKNIGFGAGHNIAIRRIIDSSDYHLVLNPDVTFKSGVLEALYNYMQENKDVGLVMPKVFYPNGQIQHTCKLLPTPLDLIFRRFLPTSMTKKKIDRFELKSSGYDKEIEVPYLSGCFMFLRTESLKKVGLFDERFFMYPEDIDLTRRMHKEYRTMFYPNVSIVHEHEKGSYKSFKLLYIHIINMIKYFNKWGWIFDKERKSINKRILSQFK